MQPPSCQQTDPILPNTKPQPGTQAIICLLVLGMIVAARAQYGHDYYRPQYETHEKKFISLPIPHLRINLDKLTLPIPNLMSLFSSHSSHHDDDDDDEHYYPPHY